MEHKQAPTGSCIFGDDLILQEMVKLKFPSGTSMNCQAFFDYVITKNQSPKMYCAQNAKIKERCCASCQSCEHFYY